MSISTRIQSAIESVESLDFIADDHVSWSGPEVNDLVTKWRGYIEVRPFLDKRGYKFPNSAVQAVAILATLISQRVPVIFNYSDVAADLTAWLERSHLSLLMTSPDLEPLLAKEPLFKPSYMTISAQGQVLKLVSETSLGPWVKNLTERPAPGTALIIFTSGSTGQPKGIAVPAEGLLQTADFLIPYLQLSPATIAPAILPVCHSLTLNTHFLPTILAGGRCYFVDTQLDFNKLYRIILQHKATFISLIGEILSSCWDEMQRRSLPRAEHVQHIQLAGGMISEHHLQLAHELFPNAVIHKGYGLTEGIRAAMINSRDPLFLSDSVGNPLPFVQIEIRNEEGRPLSPTAIGEIFIKGPNVTLGVNGKKSPLLGADQFLATGDLGHWNTQGQLCITGRKDGVFKINGHRVSGLEIETIAMRLSNVIKNAKCIVAAESSRRPKIILLLEVPHDLQDLLSESF